MSFARIFDEAAERYPADVAVIGSAGQLTYAQLNEGASRFANGLRGLGLKERDKICVLAGNTEAYVEVLLGCFKANITACLLNTRLSAAELWATIEPDRIAAVVFDQKTEPNSYRLREMFGDREVRFIGIDATLGDFEIVDFRDLIRESAAVLEPVEASDDDIAIQLYTSGTTGVPKAAQHTCGSLMLFIMMYGFTAKHCPGASPMPVQERFLCVLPLYHMSGFTTLYALACGGTLILQDGFSMTSFLQAIEQFRINRTTVPATVVEWMADDPRLDTVDTSSLIELAYGGAPIEPAALMRARDRLSCPLTQAYGSTESMIATILAGPDHHVDPSPQDRRACSVGKPIVGAQIQVVGPAGEECPVGLDGQIMVRSPALMRGYLGRSAGESGIDEDGWFGTGDIGHLDERGFLYLTGRRSDLIISGGENIYPREVENCVRGLPGVLEVAVIGAPDQKWGEVPVAFVVAKAGSNLTEPQVIGYCGEHIAHYKRPRRVFFVEQIPVDALGKSSRKMLHELYRASVADPSQRTAGPQ